MVEKGEAASLTSFASTLARVLRGIIYLPKRIHRNKFTANVVKCFIIATFLEKRPTFSVITRESIGQCSCLGVNSLYKFLPYV